ncbi:hypothetical protein CEXT_642501 [Caerostris extrusa]|uniref:Uncharacterized protein n=1 Tax=Caerostris extrusa TaxID=172846 RepID=A0AAV4Q545_CAEEX|nr:hypothetical protein CEXT_642501 [Caerostris extrusa]
MELAQFYMYFPAKLSCQTHHNSTLEHEHKKKNHPEKSSSSNQDEFYTIYGNDIHDTGNAEEMRPSTFNASEGFRNTIRFYKRSREE